MGVHVTVLGGFAVRVDGAEVPAEAWARRAASGLVKLLALAPGHRLHREQVIDALWPDADLAAAAPRLHKAVYFARQAVGRRDAITTQGELLVFFPDEAIAVDAVEFESAARVALRAGDEPAMAAAVAGYGGPLLPGDVYEAWTEGWRGRLQLLHLELLRALGRWEEVLVAAPLDEAAHLGVLRRLVHAGDRAGAVQHYERLERLHHEELGVGPSPEAKVLYDTALSLPATSGPRVPAAHRRLDPAAAPLPIPPTPMVGRERDVERVRRLAGDARLVTLLGPGGVGKTRLAVDVAAALASQHDDGARFVALARVREADQVAGLVRESLGIERTVDDDVACLRAGLRDASVLLVLDNLEHVVDAAPLVADLLAHVPGLRVLATSRERLRLAGEAAYEVGPLEVDAQEPGRNGEAAPAVTLFEQCARLVDPAFTLSAANRDAVTGVCRAVGGLPLAIELAAARVRVLPPALLLVRLSNRMQTLTGGMRDRPERHQTMRATIEWSYDLLRPAERALFDQLGVFSSPVGLDSIEAVCVAPDGEDVVELLEGLVDKSLVRRLPDRQGRPRFGLLELIHDFALARLDEWPTGDADALRSRHAAEVAAFVLDLERRRWADAISYWVEEMRSRIADINAAYEWAARHGPHEVAATITGLICGLGLAVSFFSSEQDRRWIVQSLGWADELSPSVLGFLHRAAGNLHFNQSAGPEAREHFAAALDLFRGLGDVRNIALCLSQLAGTWIGDADHYEQAVAQCREAVELARAAGETHVLGSTLNHLGELARAQGDDDLATASYEESLALVRATGNLRRESIVLVNSSFLAEHRGDHGAALATGRRALELSWRLDQPLLTGSALGALAGPELGVGRAERAARLIGASDQTLADLGVTRQPGDQVEYERVRGALERALGAGPVAALRAEGAAMGMADAVAYALSDEASGASAAPGR